MDFKKIAMQIESCQTKSDLEKCLSEYDTPLQIDSSVNAYHGKVRRISQLENGNLEIFHTDKLSAFDCYITDVPFKGIILAFTTRWWFEQIDFLPHHYVQQLDNRRLECLKLTPFKIELVVRGYLAGSLLRNYTAGQKEISGLTLPEGLLPFQKFSHPIITPTTKAPAFEHDEETSGEKLIASHVCTHAEWEKICDYAQKLFRFGSEILLKKGWILADTKYEFGKNAAGEIFLIDEIHTPDSSRFWRAKSYKSRLEADLEPEMLDKENVRQFLIRQGFQGQGSVPEVPVSEIKKLLSTYLEIYLSLNDVSLS